jgi:hypothetical protein
MRIFTGKFLNLETSLLLLLPLVCTPYITCDSNISCREYSGRLCLHEAVRRDTSRLYPYATLVIVTQIPPSSFLLPSLPATPPASNPRRDGPLYVSPLAHLLMSGRSPAVETQRNFYSLQPSIIQAAQSVHSQVPKLAQVWSRESIMLDSDAFVAWLS